MKVKLETSFAPPAEAAVDDLRSMLYANPGVRIVVVAELAHTERTQPAPDEEKTGTVKLGVKYMEVARGADQEEHLRRAMHALKVQRTAYGTFDAELGELQLSESTLEACADRLVLSEVARLRAALEFEVDRLDRLTSGTFSEREMRTELRKVLKAARDALKGFAGEDAV